MIVRNKNYYDMMALSYFNGGEASLREIDERAMQAAQDLLTLSCFISDYEAYILKCASKAAKRYITKNDDEWSVAVEAFSNAVKMYSFEKGSFLSFAELIINRRLIDYFRSQNRFQPEFPVSPNIFSGELEEDAGDLLLANEIIAKTNENRDNSLKDEIEAVNAEFAAYGFSFFDLIKCSPKSQKTKEACHKAVTYINSDPGLYREMRKTKNLPLKLIEINAKVPRKILERHRKYIVAIVEIIKGDYPGLSEYMQTFKKERFI